MPLESASFEVAVGEVGKACGSSLIMHAEIAAARGHIHMSGVPDIWTFLHSFQTLPRHPVAAHFIGRLYT